MEPQGQLAEFITAEAEISTELDSSLTEEYKKLSDKCDTVIAKIKNRKSNKKTKNAG